MPDEMDESTPNPSRPDALSRVLAGHSIYKAPTTETPSFLAAPSGPSGPSGPSSPSLPSLPSGPSLPTPPAPTFVSKTRFMRDSNQERRPSIRQ